MLEPDPEDPADPVDPEDPVNDDEDDDPADPVEPEVLVELPAESPDEDFSELFPPLLSVLLAAAPSVLELVAGTLPSPLRESVR